MKQLQVNTLGEWRKVNKFQKRRWQIAKLLEYGLSVEQAAEVLLVSPQTVEQYRNWSIDKYRVVNGSAK